LTVLKVQENISLNSVQSHLGEFSLRILKARLKAFPQSVEKDKLDVPAWSTLRMSNGTLSWTGKRETIKLLKKS